MKFALPSVVFRVALPIAILAAGWLARPRDVPLQPDRHLWVSLTMALNEELCGTSNVDFGASDVVLDLASAVHDQPALVKSPLRDVATGRSARAEDYCAQMTTHYLNNENSLMWLLRTGLVINPAASLDWLGQWLVASKLLGVALFIAGCVAVRMHPGLIAVAVIIALSVLQQFTTVYFYSVYSFLFVALLAYCGGWFLLLRFFEARRLYLSIAGAVWVGFLAAFVVNLRTSYAPIVSCVALCGVIAALRLWHDRPAPRRLRIAVGVALSLMVGYVAFYVLLIRPLIPSGAQTKPNMAHHIVSHPLVLGLALPPNALAQREGIAWDDSVGLQLAAGTNPTAKYLSDDYADALWSYYFRLWREHPSEMFGIYTLKAQLAGTGAIREAMRFESSAWMFRGALLPLLPLPDGRLLLAVYALTFVTYGIVSWRRRSLTSIAATLFALILLLLQLEATLIVPGYNLKLHAPLVGFAALLGCCLIAAAATAAARLLPSPGTRLHLEAATAATLVVVTAIVASFMASLPLEGQWSAALVAGALAAIVYIAFARLGGYRWSVGLIALLIAAVSLRAVAIRADDVDRLRSPVPYGEQPPPAATIGNLLPDTGSWVFMASNAQLVPDQGLVIRGQAESPYGYLVTSKPVSLKSGDFVVARGTLYEGGVTLGLQLKGQWATVVNVERPGKFSVAVRAPTAGEYQIVVANALSAEKLTNSATVSELGIAQ